MNGNNDDDCTDLCTTPSCGDGFIQDPADGGLRRRPGQQRHGHVHCRLQVLLPALTCHGRPTAAARPYQSPLPGRSFSISTSWSPFDGSFFTPMPASASIST